MYCENCGRKLEEGEICSCRKKSVVNIAAIISFLIIIGGIVLFLYLNFKENTFLDRIPLDPVRSVKKYLRYGLPGIIFLLGMIVSSAAIHTKKWRIFSCFALIGNFAGMIIMSAFLVWTGYQGRQLARLVSGEMTFEEQEKVRSAYNALEWEDPERQQIEKQLSEKVTDIINSYNNEEITYEEAEEKLEDVGSLNILTSEIFDSKDRLLQLKESKDNYQKALELEKESDTLWEAAEYYRKVVKEDANYEKAQTRAGELADSLADTYKNNVKELAENKNYQDALMLLDDCMELMPDDSEYVSMKEQYEKEYADYTVQVAEQLIGEKKYDQAKITINETLSFTEDERLREKLSEIESFKPIALYDLYAIAGADFEVSEEMVDSYGNTHINAMRFDAGNNARAIYQLGGQYGKFSANLVASEETGLDAKMNIAVFADDELVYSMPNYTRQQGAQKIEIDLTDVQKLEIQTNNESGRWDGLLYLAETCLEKNPNPQEPEKLYERLSDNVVIDSGDTESFTALLKDSYGELHSESIRLEAYRDGYVLFNLNQKYADFSGKIVTSEETASNALMTVRMYVDDKLVFEKKHISKAAGEIPFSVNTEGGGVLKIEAVDEKRDEGWKSNCYIYIVDDKLFFESTDEIKQAEAESAAESAAADDEAAVHRYEICLLDCTWEQAFNECIQKGGHLVRINTQEEYDYLVKELEKNNLRGYQFFIGGRRELDSFRYYWADNSNILSGETLNEVGVWCAPIWLLNEPSFEDKATRAKEHVMNMFFYKDEAKWVWNDVPNSLLEAAPNYSGKIGYICEYND